MSLLPEKMARIRIIASNTARGTIISALHDYGVIQLEPVSPDLSGMLKQGVENHHYRDLNSYLQKFRGMETQLPKRPMAGKRQFATVEELLEAASSVKSEKDIKMLRDEEADILTEIREIEQRQSAVQILKHVDYDLSVFNNRYIASYIVQREKGKDIRGTVTAAMADSRVIDLGNGYLLIAIPEKMDSELAQVASREGFKLIHVPVMTGKPGEYYDFLNVKLSENRRSLNQVRSNLNELSDRVYENIAQIREALEIEVKKMEASEKLGSTKDSFAMEGWIPEKYFGPLKDKLNFITAGRMTFSRVETDEVPPTILDNRGRLGIFEFFVRFYSLPRSGEIDPTTIFAIVFPFFFGLMVGDWGYGLTILGISLWLIHRLDHPARKSHIPRALSRFVLTIMGPSSLRTLGRALIPGALVAVGVGLLFNNFFGFPLLPYTVFSVTTGFGGATIFGFPAEPPSMFSVDFMVRKLLLFSGFMGLGMVSLGLVFGMINRFRFHHVKEAIGRLGWLIFAWGVSLLGLALIHGTVSLNFSSSPETLIYLILLIAGLGMIVGTEKAQGGMEIPSIISHILSYTRILGILLASVILSQIIDLIFLKGVNKSPELAVVGIFILVFGQIFNLVIAVFEPGIQGARLIYVEFFSKFFTGNGKIFRPFGTHRAYTEKTFELDAPQEKRSRRRSSGGSSQKQ